MLSLLDHACDALKPKNNIDTDTAAWQQEFLLQEVAEQSRRLAKLTITYAEFPVENIEEKEAYTQGNLFADLGGTFGLAAGLSMVRSDSCMYDSGIRSRVLPASVRSRRALTIAITNQPRRFVPGLPHARPLIRIELRLYAPAIAPKRSHLRSNLNSQPCSTANFQHPS